jgi:ribosomal protein S18 acetylase RimI-like enzyme
MTPTIEVAGAATDDLVQALAKLLPQLSTTAGSLDRDEVARLLAHEANTLLVARASGGIVGCLTLVMFPLPSGLRARIEDVVVDEAARGQGIGKKLNQEALRLAQSAGARTVDLTSRPSRAAANRLYERMGFQRRYSNIYRYDFA